MKRCQWRRCTTGSLRASSASAADARDHDRDPGRRVHGRLSRRELPRARRPRAREDASRAPQRAGRAHRRRRSAPSCPRTSQAAIRDPEIDAVDVCLPTPLHREPPRRRSRPASTSSSRSRSRSRSRTPTRSSTPPTGATACSWSARPPLLARVRRAAAPARRGELGRPLAISTHAALATGRLDRLDGRPARSPAASRSTC